MDSQTILMCVVALILGMLLFHMLKGVCGCKVVEGQELIIDNRCSATILDLNPYQSKQSNYANESSTYTSKSNKVYHLAPYACDQARQNRGFIQNLVDGGPQHVGFGISDAICNQNCPQDIQDNVIEMANHGHCCWENTEGLSNAYLEREGIYFAGDTAKGASYVAGRNIRCENYDANHLLRSNNPEPCVGSST